MAWDGSARVALEKYGILFDATNGFLTIRPNLLAAFCYGDSVQPITASKPTHGAQSPESGRSEAGRQTDRLGSDINAHLAHAACRVATARVCKVHRHAPVAPDRVSNAWGYPGRGAQHAGAGGRWQRLLVCLSVCAVVTPVVVVVVVVVPSLWAWSKSMPVSAPSGPGGRWADQTGIPAVRGPQDGSKTKQEGGG